MADKISHHEYFSSEDHIGQGGSDRSFGLVFAVVFLAFGLGPIIKGHPVRGWMLAVSGILLVLSLAKPSLLRPAKIVWAKVGFLLSKLTTPVLMGLLFYLVFTPVALLLRLLGKTPLSLTYDIRATTYWIDRTQSGQASNSMANQF